MLLGDKSSKRRRTELSNFELFHSGATLNSSGGASWNSGKCVSAPSTSSSSNALWSAAGSNASVIVMNYTLQFVPPEDRDALLARIAGGMTEGGVFILSENNSYHLK